MPTQTLHGTCRALDARFCRAAATRFDFSSRHVSIRREPGVLRSVDQSLAVLAEHRCAEQLEWILTVSIAVDIPVVVS